MALAIALASSPKLLVLDDPTLGLDAVARRELFEELIGELADRGTTVFLTSHDLAGIEAIAATLQEETDTLVDVVEPYLLKIGLIIRTPSGRKASAAALRHLGKIGKANKEKQYPAGPA